MDDRDPIPHRRPEMAAKIRRLRAAADEDKRIERWLIRQLDERRDQVTALKLRGLAVHAEVWRAMQMEPTALAETVADGGALHEAVHALIAVETEVVAAPEEWRAHIERQDRRIEQLEAEVERLRALETDHG